MSLIKLPCFCFRWRPLCSSPVSTPRPVTRYRCKAAERKTIWELPVELALSGLVWTPICDAAEITGSSYDPSAGNEFLVNAAGLGYVLLVAYFLFRVLSKRAKRYREEKLAGPRQSPEESMDVPELAVPEKKLTPLDGVIGVLQSAVFTAGLWFFTTKVDALLLQTPMPEQYTAHNIAITVRTIIRGFCYLFTFIFAMNCVGLSGLTIKLIFDPDAVNEERRIIPRDKGPQLPKISVVSDPEEVARAFDEVAKRKSEQDSA